MYDYHAKQQQIMIEMQSSHAKFKFKFKSFRMYVKICLHFIPFIAIGSVRVIMQNTDV